MNFEKLHFQKFLKSELPFIFFIYYALNHGIMCNSVIEPFGLYSLHVRAVKWPDERL